MINNIIEELTQLFCRWSSPSVSEVLLNHSAVELNENNDICDREAHHLKCKEGSDKYVACLFASVRDTLHL